MSCQNCMMCEAGGDILQDLVAAKSGSPCFDCGRPLCMHQLYISNIPCCHSVNIIQITTVAFQCYKT